MTTTSQRTRSVWMAELLKSSPPLGSMETEIAIVGAGLGGLTTAYLLAKAGRKVVIVDSGPPGGGMTMRTTGHLSNALDDRWYQLVALRGKDAALAADAHTAAIDLIEDIQRDERIDCDFARVDGYLVLASNDTTSSLEREHATAADIGLTDVSLDASNPVAPALGAAVRFPNQARFHPMKYIRGLITCIERNGGRLFTGHVTEIGDGTVKTESGHILKANAIVVATNVPINDRVTIHAKQAPYRTYAIAGEVPKGSIADALLWDTGWPYHYVRIQPAADGTKDIVIVGGEDHKTGQADDTDLRFARLEQWARRHFPSLDRIMWRWSGQVMESVDHLGYLGRMPGRDQNIYCISGDSGMGMTHTTIGAMIISDAILGRSNRWTELFDPSRITIKAAPTFARENLNVAAQMSAHARPGDVSSPEDIHPGAGAVMRRGSQKIAVYKRADSSLVEMSAVCPHRGCVVNWNHTEACWDCPCHGSQFAAEGEVINGPAVHGLPAATPEREVQAPSVGEKRPGIPH
jgi:glycine/D-amino acid oxidase-like deaminating enzyme/nitrite reductase/ring-hydroxylating ferredoxin subunit